MSELTIVATLVAKPKFQEILEKELRTLAEESRKESGNISYEIHRNKENPLKYIVLENWKSQEAIEFHNSSSHYQKFIKIVEGQLDILTINITEKIF